MKNSILIIILIALCISCNKESKTLELNILSYDNNQLKFQLVNNSSNNIYFPINYENLLFSDTDFLNKKNGIYAIIKNHDNSKVEDTEVTYYPSIPNNQIVQDSLFRETVPEFKNKSLGWINYYKSNFTNNIFLQKNSRISLSTYYNASFYNLKKGKKYRLKLAIVVDSTEFRKYAYDSLLERLEFNKYKIFQGVLISNEISFIAN